MAAEAAARSMHTCSPRGSPRSRRDSGATRPRRDARHPWLLSLLALAFIVAALVLGAAAAASDLEVRALRSLGLALVATGAPPPHVDAVAVHGGGSVKHERELPAVSLFADGRVDWLIAMGGPTGCCDPDKTYANAVHRRLLGLGAPPAKTIRLDEGGSTYEELLALRKLAEARGWRSIAISTANWHTLRSSLAAARAFAGSGITWTEVALPEGDVDLDHWWQAPHGRETVLGEWRKIAWFLLLAR